MLNDGDVDMLYLARYVWHIESMLKGSLSMAAGRPYQKENMGLNKTGPP